MLVKFRNHWIEESKVLFIGVEPLAEGFGAVIHFDQGEELTIGYAGTELEAQEMVSAMSFRVNMARAP